MDNIKEELENYFKHIKYSTEFSSALEYLEEEQNKKKEYSSMPTPQDKIDKVQIDRILRSYCVSPDPRNALHPFAHFQHELLSFNPKDNINVQKLKRYELFDKAYMGYKIFCALFLQDDKQNSNAIRMMRFTSVLPFLGGIELHRLMKLTKGIGLTILKALANIGDNQVDNHIKEVPFDQKRQGFFEALYERNPRNPFLQLLLGVEEDVKRQTEEVNLSAYKRDDLLRSYYSQILQKTGGVEKKAASLIAMPYTSFRDDLGRLGIKRKKRNKNT